MNKRPKVKQPEPQGSETRLTGECVVSQQDIRETAFRIYETRSGGYGTALADWLEAEQHCKKAAEHG